MKDKLNNLLLKRKQYKKEMDLLHDQYIDTHQIEYQNCEQNINITNDDIAECLSDMSKDRNILFIGVDDPLKMIGGHTTLSQLYNMYMVSNENRLTGSGSELVKREQYIGSMRNIVEAIGRWSKLLPTA